jgi:hypothetical protein
VDNSIIVLAKFQGRYVTLFKWIYSLDKFYISTPLGETFCVERAIIDFGLGTWVDEVVLHFFGFSGFRYAIIALSQ